MTDDQGSIWRKWDLHVHTPASLVNEYGADNDATWEKFITDLEDLSDDYKVLGINDYLFIEGYRRLKHEKEVNGRLKNIDLLLPVIEFRIEKLAGVEFRDVKRINYHVIFSDKVEPEIIQSQFLDTLQQHYVLGTDGTQWNRAINRQSMEELGKKIKSSVPKDKLDAYGSDAIEGFNNINIRDEEIRKSLAKDCFDGLHLTAVGKTEWDQLSWSDASIATKKTIINSVDLVFTSAESVAKFESAKEKLIAQKVNSRLLDCSDAHRYSDDTNKDRIGMSYTWIKADTTFEGLKQIMYEPDRLAISETRPLEPTNTISSFTLNLPKKASIRIKQNDGTMKTEEFCFAETSGTYALSPYFNCIVGGRGTGKSTILNFLGQHSSEDNSSKDFWKKLSPSFDPKNPAIFSFDGVKQFEFVGQSEVESFAMDKEAFTNAIYIRADILSSGALSQSEGQLEPLLEKLSDYQSTIIDISGLEDEVAQLDIEEDTLQKSVKITQSEKYETIVEQITNDSHDVQELATWRESIEEYRNAIQETQDSFEDDEDAEETDVSQTETVDDQAVPYVAEPYETAFAEARSSVQFALERIDESNFEDLIKKEEKLQAAIHKNEEALSQLLEKAGLSEENILQVKSAPQKLVRLKEQRFKLQKRIDEKAAKLTNYGTTMSKIGAAKDAFEKQIKSAIEPLNNILKEQAEQNKQKDIKEIRLEYYLDEQSVWLDIADNFYETFENYSEGERADLVRETIISNRTVFAGDHEQIQQFIEKKMKGNGEAGYLRFLNEVFQEKYNYDIFKAIRDRISNDASTYRRIQVLYGGRGIEHASFGQKCTAVVVILMLFGNYPLIIDEPEAHLDGSLIANYLVPLIKHKKTNRQIIFATHNANFVINGDAEKIVILKNDGHTVFVETTIENDEHREDLLKLEGGKEAFKKRSDKLKIL